MEKFLNDTLKKESKLSKKTLEHKQLLLDKLTKFYEENPQMVPTQSTDTLQGNISIHRNDRYSAVQMIHQYTEQCTES